MDTKSLDFQAETPLYLQLKDVLAQSLADDVDNSGKLPTFKKIAEKYRVSIVTAVKAVEKLKNEGFIYSRPGKGLYLKNKTKLAEFCALQTQTKTIGVTFLDIYNTSCPYLSEVIRSLSEECYRLNLNLQIFTTPSGNLGLKENPLLWKNIKKKNLAGLILASRMPVQDVIFLKEEGIPFVWLANDLPGEDIACVMVDKFYSLNLILTYLSNLKYHRIAFLSAQDEPVLKSAFDVICSNYNLEGHYYLTEGPEKEVGYILTKEVLNKDKPQVLITRGSELTASCLSLISELNFSLPEDLALISSVSSLSVSFSPKNITLLYNPVAEMAQKAIQMLVQILNGEETANKRQIVSTKLIIRGSCGFPLKGRKEIRIDNITELKKLFRR